MKKYLIFTLSFLLIFTSIFFIPSEYNCAKAEAAEKWEETEEAKELKKKKMKRMKRVKVGRNPYVTGLMALAIGTDGFGMLESEEVDQWLDATEQDLYTTSQAVLWEHMGNLTREGLSIGFHWVTDTVADWISDKINEYRQEKINQGELPYNGHLFPSLSLSFDNAVMRYPGYDNTTITYRTPILFTWFTTGLPEPTDIRAIGYIIVKDNRFEDVFYVARVISDTTSYVNKYQYYPNARVVTTFTSKGTREEAISKANDRYWEDFDWAQNRDELASPSEFFEILRQRGITNENVIDYGTLANRAIPKVPRNFPYIDNAQIDSIGVTYFDNEPYLEYWVQNPNFDPDKPEHWLDNPRYIRYWQKVDPEIKPGQLPQTPPEIIPETRPNPNYVPQPGEDPYPPGVPAPAPERIYEPYPDLDPDPDPAPGPGPGPGPDPGPDPGPGPGPGPGPAPGTPPGTPGPTEDGDWQCEKEYDGEKWTKIVQNISTRFPFSIPWDIGRAIDAFFGGMGNHKPSFEIPLFYQNKTVKLEIPNFIDEWIGVARTLMVFMFDIYIIYALRKFWGGQE